MSKPPTVPVTDCKHCQGKICRKEQYLERWVVMCPMARGEYESLHMQAAIEHAEQGEDHGND